MKLIHCADVHLDSPMKTHLSAEQARVRNAEITRTFERMTQYAAAQGADAVLIAGDLFDSARVTLDTVDMVFSAMQKTPQVRYLYLRGNHDESDAAFAGRTLPENLFCFGDRWRTFELGDAAVSGIDMTDANAEALYDAVPHIEGKCNIAALHGQIGTVGGTDRVDLSRLRGKGIDYLALGHLHAYQTGALGRGLWCYPGCLEGRGFDECGEKGFVWLETAGGRLAKAEFVPFAKRALHRVPVDVTGMETNAQVRDAMRQAAAALPQDDLVEFVLTGTVGPESRIAPDYLLRLARDDFFAVKLKNESRLAVPATGAGRDVSLKGAYLQRILASDFSDEDKQALIRIGLEALRGEEITL